MMYVGWVHNVQLDGKLDVIWMNPYAHQKVAINETLEKDILMDHLIDPQDGKTPSVPLFSPVSGRVLPYFFHMVSLPEGQENQGL